MKTGSTPGASKTFQPFRKGLISIRVTVFGFAFVRKQHKCSSEHESAQNLQRNLGAMSTMFWEVRFTREIGDERATGIEPAFRWSETERFHRQNVFEDC